eukprot:3732984-Rhodomonas_salina.4
MDAGPFCGGACLCEAMCERMCGVQTPPPSPLPRSLHLPRVLHFRHGMHAAFVPSCVMKLTVHHHHHHHHRHSSSSAAASRSSSSLCSRVSLGSLPRTGPTAQGRTRRQRNRQAGSRCSWRGPHVSLQVSLHSADNGPVRRWNRTTDMGRVVGRSDGSM